MPIEGPLRELGLPDVFQLLDLSRKTGMLRVTSRIRNDEGTVYFDGGRVVQASVRSKPTDRIDATTVTERELARKIRAQIEGAVYDLMAWREGFFSFEEREITDVPLHPHVKIAIESLLMESARRIDEWSRIANIIPHLQVVPVLAGLPEDHETQLDLLPHEWEVLSMIDGERDLHAIATVLGRAEFEVAKVVYGLVTTGVVEIRKVQKGGLSIPAPVPGVPVPMENSEIRSSLNRGFAAARAGDLVTAREHWERFLVLAPQDPAAARVRSALDAAATLVNAIEAHGNA